MNAVEDYTSGTNPKDLAAGVLKWAAQDLRRFHGATSAIERELYLDAYRWVISDECAAGVIVDSGHDALSNPEAIHEVERI